MIYQKLKEQHQKRFNELKRFLENPRLIEKMKTKECCKDIIKTEKDFLESVLKNWPKFSH